MKAQTTKNKEVGYVTSANSYLISLEGIPSARINDIVEDEAGNRAMVASLEKDHVKALLLDDILVKAGDEFFLKHNSLTFSLGDHLFGRVINSLGTPIDGKGSLPLGTDHLEFDVVAPGIDTREEIAEQFSTGVTLVDTLFPIGKGQRQLLFGPTSSGKTTFVRDVIVNQAGRNIICIYVGVGKPTTFIERFSASVYTEGAEDYTVIIAALAESPTPVITMAPTVGFFVAEHFRMQGKTVLLVIDDLGAHAKYIRETALLMGRIPGRQSYPGDIFYQHAHLLERAGNFNKAFGGGSITVLPVIETDIENFTDLIPTNLMATTDGHLFFSPALRAEGHYPSISTERSVTRVGRQTQLILQQELTMRIMAIFVEYARQQEYVQFGTNVSSRTKDVIKQGELAKELLKQEPFDNIETHIQSALLSLVFTPFLINREIVFLRKNKGKILQALREDPQLENIREGAKKAASVSELLEQLNKSSYILEKICQQ